VGNLRKTAHLIPPHVIPGVVDGRIIGLEFRPSAILVWPRCRKSRFWFRPRPGNPKIAIRPPANGRPGLNRPLPHPSPGTACRPSATSEQLEANGAHFRSLRDPIDTTTPQGVFSLQVLGAVAQLERALIAERTKAGLQAARKRGRIGGNPGLRAGDPAPSARFAPVVMPRISTVSWRSWTRGCRPCGGCARTSPGATFVRVLNQKRGPSVRSNSCAARCGFWPTKASSRPACWTAPSHSRATTGWSVWSPASRRQRANRCSRSPPNLKPCANEHGAVARVVGQAFADPGGASRFG
jgi:Resolvase, N terminal domain